MIRSNQFTKKPIVIALGAAFALGGAVANGAPSSIFQVTDLAGGYQLAAADTTKPAEGKCGEGKCGAGMKSADGGSMDHSKMGMKHMDGMSMTGDTDYDFAANMRMHHQMAVDMSEAELKNGENPEMLQMAKSIIAAQKKEIAELDRWLAAHKKPK
jgi:uncharacterized protein (DUF305 family)